MSNFNFWADWRAFWAVQWIWWVGNVGNVATATWQCGINNLVMWTWQLSKLFLATYWSGCALGNLAKWTWQNLQLSLAILLIKLWLQTWLVSYYIRNPLFLSIRQSVVCNGKPKEQWGLSFSRHGNEGICDPTPTSAPASIGNLLWLSCGWITTPLVSYLGNLPN